MGRAPCCDKANVKKGPWSPEEDAKLKDFIEKFGTAGNWIALPQKAGLKRCGKSCRLRWLNYLRPNIKHGEFSEEEDRIICSLYAKIGSRWSIIAAQLPGRTDNDIKNYWNTKLKKKLIGNMFSSNQPNFPPPFLTPQPQTLSTLSQLYNSFYCNQASKTLTANNTDPISSPQNYLYCNSNSSNPPLFTTSYPYYQQNQESLTDLQFYPMKDNINMLTFGANEASSSSDRSYGKLDQMKQEDMGFFQGLLIDDPMSSFLDQKASGVVENSSQLQYDIEEVKQLITAVNGTNDNLLFSDENKREGKGMYYY